MPVANFIIAGAAKCGTTSLDHYLDEHPDICMSKPKQTHFFDNDDYYKQGLEWYARCFAHHAGQKALGEATPSYLHGEYIAKRILNDLPGVKLLFIFRDPVQRAYSNFWHGWRKGRELKPFEESLNDPANRHIIERGRYAPYLKVYMDVFGRERMHIILMEQMSKDPHGVLSKVYEFLGVDPSFRGERVNERKNTNRVPRSIALQRWYYKNISGSGRPEEVSRFDEDGEMEIHYKARKGMKVRQAVGWVINRINLKPGDYPPLDPAVAQRVRPLWHESNEQFAALTGLDVQKWWKYF